MCGYIDGLIDSLLRLMATPMDVAGPTNLGNPREPAFAEFAETVIRLTGSSSKLIYAPLPSDDPKQRKPDIALVRDLRFVGLFLVFAFVLLRRKHLTDRLSS